MTERRDEPEPEPEPEPIAGSEPDASTDPFMAGAAAGTAGGGIGPLGGGIDLATGREQEGGPSPAPPEEAPIDEQTGEVLPPDRAC
jgi:hypothetical protein